MLSREPATTKRRPSEKVSKTQARAAEPHSPAAEADVLNQLIAQRAYELFEYRTARGPLDDWLEAEREIMSRNVAAPR
jgi:hypothetical protein